MSLMSQKVAAEFLWAAPDEGSCIEVTGAGQVSAWLAAPEQVPRAIEQQRQLTLSFAAGP
jgi:hypothetical protein